MFFVVTNEVSCMANNAALDSGMSEYQQWSIRHPNSLINSLFEHVVFGYVPQAEPGITVGPDAYKLTDEDLAQFD